MPLINEKVATLKSQFHCMNIIKGTIKSINPHQIPIDVSDQPVYALTKAIQWRYPSCFSLESYVPLLGDLHIEHSLLLIHGQIIKGSGLECVLERNKLSTEGTSAIVDVNDIKRARYCLQVSLCATYRKLKEAYIKANTQLPILSWLSLKSEESEMCFLWRIIFEIEIEILLFVRSIREGNFNLYLQSLYSLLKYYFALDRYNYARWAMVYWFDIASLHTTCPEVYMELIKGNFSFLKTNTHFSRIALDQVHEQNNRKIKGISGATHLINRQNDSALIRWELCGPEIDRLLTDFEDNINITNKEGISKHHEDNETFQSNFYSDVENVYNGFTCNPFELSELTMVSRTEIKFAENIFHNLSKLENSGKQQLNMFIQDRLIYGKVSIDSRIIKNHFQLLGDIDSKKKSHVDQHLNQAFVTKLRAAIAYRRAQAEMLFKSEIFGISQCLSTDAKSLYHGNKADILKRFEMVNRPVLTSPSAIIIELSAVVRFNAKVNVRSFNEFAIHLYNYIMELAKDCH